MLHVTEYLTGPAFGGQVRIARAVEHLAVSPRREDRQVTGRYRTWSVRRRNMRL